MTRLAPVSWRRGDANGAPPSMSRRGPTWSRWAGLPVARHPGPVRPTAWHGKQPLKCRLPGLPVARVSPASREFPPGRTSALAMNEFLLPPGELAQGFLASYFKIFCVIHEIHKKARVIPRERWLSTALSTAWSTARSPGRSACSGAGRAVTWVRAIQEGRGPAFTIYERECRIRNEAPPRMRWRGLVAAIEQGRRLLGYRGTVRPLHRGGKISREDQFPGAPRARPDVPVSRSARVRGSS